MPDNTRRMTPIRVPDMVWMEDDIQNKFSKHRRAYETERNSIVNANVDLAKPEYIKVMGCKKLVDDFNKASDARKEFQLTMETNLEILKAKEKEIALELEDKVNTYVDSQETHNVCRFSMRTNDYDADPDIYAFNKFVIERCKEEAEIAYEKSAKGAALKNLNDAENACYQVLHSGYDITDARRFIDKVFKDVGIDSPVIPDISQGLAWDGNK